MFLLCSTRQKELIEDFIFPASKLMLLLEKNKEPVLERAIPVCNTPQALDCAFDLLVTLCIGCPQNLKLVVTMLCDMFYSGELFEILKDERGVGRVKRLKTPLEAEFQ